MTRKIFSCVFKYIDLALILFANSQSTETDTGLAILDATLKKQYLVQNKAISPY